MPNSLHETTAVLYEQFPIKLLFNERPQNLYCFQMHWHERIEFLHIDKGSMHVVCGDDSFEAKRGDFVTFHSRKIHFATAGEQGVTYRVLMFELASLTNNGALDVPLLRAIQDGKMQFKTCINDERISSLVDAITDEYKNQNSAYQLIVKGQVCTMLGLMFRYHINETFVAASVDIHFQQVLQYIDDHYTESLSTKELAEQFCYDESYFCRKFRQSTGLTLVQYIRIMRLEMANSLLRSSIAPIQIIAKQCGYDDINYFIRCFHDRYGMSPSKIRVK